MREHGKENRKMDIERQIEFDKIKEMWMERAVTKWAKDRIKEMSFCLSESELKKQIRDTTNSRKLMERLGTPPLQKVEEIWEILTIAQKGDCLTPYQLERVEKILSSIKRLKDYLERGKMYENPLAYYEEDLNCIEDLREEIGQQIRGEKVDDYASKELWGIREKIAECEKQMRQKS